MGLLFYPRGGSAQVARYLAAALDRKGWPVRLFTGSLGEPGAVANAATFFAGLDIRQPTSHRRWRRSRGATTRWPPNPTASVVRGSWSARPAFRVARRSRGRATGRRLAAALCGGRGCGGCDRAPSSPHAAARGACPGRTKPARRRASARHRAEDARRDSPPPGARGSSRHRSHRNGRGRCESAAQTAPRRRRA